MKKVLPVVLAFLIVLGVVFVGAAALNYQEYQEGLVEVRLEIVSERDQFSEVKWIETRCGSLGKLLRTLDYCSYEESTYGIYVHGFHDMQDDTDNQYWWCLTVDGEPTNYGADDTPLKEGSVYTFTLTHGW